MNIISLRNYKTFKEMRKLLYTYKDKLNTMEYFEIKEAVEHYKIEAQKWPDHLLILIKGEMLINVLIEKHNTSELIAFYIDESIRIKKALNKKLAG